MPVSLLSANHPYFRLAHLPSVCHSSLCEAVWRWGGSSLANLLATPLSASPIRLGRRIALLSAFLAFIMGSACSHEGVHQSISPLSAPSFYSLARLGFVGLPHELHKQEIIVTFEKLHMGILNTQERMADRGEAGQPKRWEVVLQPAFITDCAKRDCRFEVSN